MFAAKRAALARDLSLPSDTPLSDLIAAGTLLMGIAAEGTAPQMLDLLITEMGITVPGTVPDGAVGSAACGTAVPIAACGTTVGSAACGTTVGSAACGTAVGSEACGTTVRSAAGRRKHTEPAVLHKQTKLFAGGWSDVAKLSLSKKHLDIAAARKERAVPFDELSTEVALDVRQLPSEKAAPAPPPKPVYACSSCPKVFSMAMALGNHVKWKHPAQGAAPPVRKALLRPFLGKITVPLSVSADGHVRGVWLINGKDQEQVPTPLPCSASTACLCQHPPPPLHQRQRRPVHASASARTRNWRLQCRGARRRGRMK